MRIPVRSIIAAALIVVGLAGTAHAERFVIVNGARLSIPQIMYLERVRCGPIPNGNYWLNGRTGMWGYAGNPRAMGHIKDNCRRPGRRPSLSERGQLFSTYDWVR